MKHFTLQFLTNWASHCTIVDVICDVMWMMAINLAAGPRIALRIPESCLAKDQSYICWAMLTVSSKVLFPRCLMFFLFLFVFWKCLEGFYNQDRGRRYHVNLGLSVLSGQFYCNSQLLPITSSFGDVITNLFWTDTGRLIFAATADMTLTSPLVHLRYKTLIPLGSDLNGMVEAAGIR